MILGHDPLDVCLSLSKNYVTSVLFMGRNPRGNQILFWGRRVPSALRLPARPRFPQACSRAWCYPGPPIHLSDSGRGVSPASAQHPNLGSVPRGSRRSSRGAYPGLCGQSCPPQVPKRPPPELAPAEEAAGWTVSGFKPLELGSGVALAGLSPPPPVLYACRSPPFGAFLYKRGLCAPCGGLSPWSVYIYVQPLKILTQSSLEKRTIHITN